ncbi:M6 family metalloprotease domain-containing protein [Asanoa siamensis]|uniref:P/Homo B domain-containing protein n=1 Tax=Asanoa siamensis TaxID=926357 RepID=A0ABQ4CLY5_9ACTN|nr:M6 family metalloprotease domain-containing protein [Asanoa siamensis]GIF71993.1 hypothetical protein Asi02nite_15110 [Asanoa siamensis]
MSAIFGETLRFQQRDGDDVALVVLGDEMYARYETPEGYTAVYDQHTGAYCYADLDEGRFASTGHRVDAGPPPPGSQRHLHESAAVRNGRVKARHEAMVPPGEAAGGREKFLTFGPSGGLLPGRRLSSGAVTGLTILVDFPDNPAAVAAPEVDGLLNGTAYTGGGNAGSVRSYFRTMSTGRLDFSNVVVGPFRMSRPRLFYANTEGQLVPEAIQLALAAGVDLTRFDSCGEGIVDSLCIMYAGQTEYKGDLWPHNFVHREEYNGVRTELYIVTSAGRRAEDLSIGTFCHEAGHMLCRFPDLYDYGLAEREGDDFKSAGVGMYCVMGAGNHLDRGRTPAPISAYLRNLVGWTGTEVDLNAGGRFEAKQGDYDTVMRWSTGLDNEYFLVENRARAGFDLHLPSSGLAVYHCDTRGSNEFQQGTREQHYQCAVLQADGHLDLEANANQGDGGDLFGRVVGTAVSHATRPATRRWDGVESGLTISDVSAPGEVITFQVGEVGDAGASVVGKSEPRAVIPDGDMNGVADTITFDSPGTVRAMTFEADITHPFAGDLRIVLLSPTGRRAVLHDRVRTGRNLHLELDSEPPSALAPMVGQPVAGDWLLRVTDASSDDAGTLERWRIEITVGT